MAISEKDVAVSDEVSSQLEQAAHERPWAPYLDMALGLRNYWYPAFFSIELEEGKTRMEEIGGERILFKRVKGSVYAVQDRCLHRGVSFSSRPECYTENTLTCWFHGFTYDVRDGKLVQVLSQPGSQLIGQVALKTYPIREEFRTVFVYIGDGEPVPFEQDLPPILQRALSGEERRAFHPLVRVRIPCDWRLATENAFDPGHVYGHRTATVRQFRNGPLVTYPETNMTEFLEEPGVANGMLLTGRREWTQVWEAEVEGQIVVKAVRTDEGAASPPPTDGAPRPVGGPFLPCLFIAATFPDGKQSHFEWFVPIDEGHHMYTINQSLPVANDEEEERFHEEADNKWGPLVWSTDPDIVGFNNYDAFGRAQVMHGYNKEDFWHKEYFYKPDFVLTQWRKFVVKRARGVQRRTDMQPKGVQEPSVEIYNNEPGTVR